MIKFFHIIVLLVSTAFALCAEAEESTFVLALGNKTVTIHNPTNGTWNCRYALPSDNDKVTHPLKLSRHKDIYIPYSTDDYPNYILCMRMDLKNGCMASKKDLREKPDTFVIKGYSPCTLTPRGHA